MPARERSSTLLRPKGHYEKNGIIISSGSETFASINACADITGPGDNAPLSVRHVTFEGGLINRPYTEPPIGHFIDYVADVLDNSNEFGHIAIAEDGSDAYYATLGAARSNPSAPIVDVPTAIFELRELPELLRSTGNNIISAGARTNLRYQFGIAPLVGDLVKLLNFHDIVSRRVKVLNNLHARGFRKTNSVGSYAAFELLNRVIQSDGLFVGGTFSGHTTLDVRVHSRWFPIVGHPYPSTDAEQRALATRAVLGLTVDSSTLWNALPWSWLVDWCSSAGQYFTATRNIVGANLNDISVMRHTKTKWSWDGASAGNWSVSPITVVRENKTRMTSFVAPVAHFPFLSGQQMGILGSLAVLRM